MTEVPVRHFRGRDGVQLAYRELGEGRPLILIHGYLGSAMTMLQAGIAGQLAAQGYRVIMPDLRGHGDSARPHDPAAYPPDALVRDAQTLIAHLGLTDYDLGAYSLGARLGARLMAVGARPRRAVLGGTGLEPILHAVGRGDKYRRLFAGLGSYEPDTPEGQMQEYLTSVNADPVALLNIFDTFADTPGEALRAVPVPTLVIAGEDDTERGSAEDLAGVLPHGEVRRVPGDHVSTLLGPEFRDALAAFLA